MTKREIACALAGLVLGVCLGALFFSTTPEAAANQIQLLKQENEKLRDLNEVRTRELAEIRNVLNSTK